MKNNLEQLKRIKNIINNNKTNPNISLLLTLTINVFSVLLAILVQLMNI